MESSNWRRYIYLCILTFLPSLSGCFLGTLHMKGEMDVESIPVEAPLEDEKAL